MLDSQASMSVFHRLIRQVIRGILPRTKGSLHASVRESIRLYAPVQSGWKRRTYTGGNPEEWPDPVLLKYPSAVKDYKRTCFRPACQSRALPLREET
jgi:hypothetical protein